MSNNSFAARVTKSRSLGKDEEKFSSIGFEIRSFEVLIFSIALLLRWRSLLITGFEAAVDGSCG